MFPGSATLVSLLFQCFLLPRQSWSDALTYMGLALIFHILRYVLHHFGLCSTQPSILIYATFLMFYMTCALVLESTRSFSLLYHFERTSQIYMVLLQLPRPVLSSMGIVQTVAVLNMDGAVQDITKLSPNNMTQQNRNVLSTKVCKVAKTESRFLWFLGF
eukprot:4447989-Amphidinium_carterae.1